MIGRTAADVVYRDPPTRAPRATTRRGGRRRAARRPSRGHPSPPTLDELLVAADHIPLVALSSPPGRRRRSASRRCSPTSRCGPQRRASRAAGTSCSRSPRRRSWTRSHVRGSTAPNQDSPQLRQLLQPEPPRRKAVDSLRVKRIHDGSLALRGSESHRQITSFEAARVILDEAEQTQEETYGLAHRRLSSSDDGRLSAVSTPGFAEAGIDACFHQSDQQHYHLPCPARGLNRPLSWPESIDFERALVVCRASCSHKKRRTSTTRTAIPWACWAAVRTSSVEIVSNDGDPDRLKGAACGVARRRKYRRKML